MLLAFLGLLGFVALGLWMVQTAKNDSDGIVGLISIGFFGLTAIAALWRIFTQRTVVFSPAGLEFGAYGGRKRVAWSNIASTTIWRHKGQAINSLWLADPAAIEGPGDGGGENIIRSLNVALGAGHIALGWADRDRRAEEFDELLQAWIRRYGRSAD